jgi:hypothetical protein
MKNKIDCRKKKYKNLAKCRFKRMHNKVCKSRSSEVGTVAKAVFSVTSPQAAVAVAATDIGKFVYKKSFC